MLPMLPLLPVLPLLPMLPGVAHRQTVPRRSWQAENPLSEGEPAETSTLVTRTLAMLELGDCRLSRRGAHLSPGEAAPTLHS